MSTINIKISNNFKYNCYHVIVFIMFILTCIKLHNDADNFTIFVLFVIIIQILLYCFINTNNHYLEIPPCCYIFIGFTNLSTSIAFIPYIFTKLDKFKNIKDKTVNSIYLICLTIYIPVVIIFINWYYLSSEKYREINCLFHKPKIPKLSKLSINLPRINIPVKSIIFRNSESCTICIQPYSPLNKRTKLDCEHEMCDVCLRKINSINKKCPFCKSNII